MPTQKRHAEVASTPARDHAHAYAHARARTYIGTCPDPEGTPPRTSQPNCRTCGRTSHQGKRGTSKIYVVERCLVCGVAQGVIWDR